MFPLHLRVGEASALKNADIKCDRHGRPCGALLSTSCAPASALSSVSDAPFDRRPKGAKHPGGKEWAPAVDELARDALAKVLELSHHCASERRLNDFIRVVADREQWSPGWWSSHGMRHGRVQDRLRCNVSPQRIMAEGRWRSRGAFDVYLS